MSGVIKMGSVKKAFKKVERFTKKNIIKPIDKAIIEPLEKPVKSVAKAVDKAIVEPLEKPVKAVIKPVGEVFEELIEKPVKKIATETFDVVMNVDKEERRAMLGDAPKPATTPEITPEVTPEVVPDETIMSRGTRRTKGKRAGQAGTLMEGYGVAYSKPSAKSPTGGQ